MLSVLFVCYVLFFFPDKFHVRLLYDRICGPRELCVCVRVSVRDVYVCIFFIYTLFTLHATLQVSNTTCIVVTYLYSSLPFYL